GGVPLDSVPGGCWIMVALLAPFTLVAGRWAFRKRGDY
ncbi:magnesium transporter CorA, partial [Pseudomonas syringae]|nr:magnesium transporter CorA [Pseudomonas syringae]